MSEVVSGFVKDGVVIPALPLSERARVEIVVHEVVPELPPELAAEVKEWDRASDEDFRMVERLRERRPLAEAG